METTELGEFRLTPTGERREREGQTAKRSMSSGTAEIYLLEGHTVALELGVTNWLNGDREVSCLSRLT